MVELGLKNMLQHSGDMIDLTGLSDLGPGYHTLFMHHRIISVVTQLK